MFPNKKYNVIYADPPWNVRYATGSSTGIVDLNVPYPTMSDEEIMRLPVKNIVDSDCLLFLWCVDSRIPLLPRVMGEWGFKYKTVGFVWHKRSRYTDYENAIFSTYTRKSCEFCYIGKRGKIDIKDYTVPQFVSEPKRKHSEKPDCIRRYIERLCGDLPRIELFARHIFKGWDIWGNQCPSDIQERL